MNRRTKPRWRRREERTPEQQAYEAAACELLYALDGRSHPDRYSATRLRGIVLADIVSGKHGVSAPHVWFMARAVGNIAAAEGKDAETVTQELLAEAEHRRPGVTL